MPIQYETVKFLNNPKGITDKNRISREMVAQGWHISSETIEPGHIIGAEVCCGATICLPLAALAGRTPGYIVVTYARDTEDIVHGIPCKGCGTRIPRKAKFCRKCGTPQRQTQ